MSYTASTQRYAHMPYRRAGRSGLVLPPLSLGLWHNFGGEADPEHIRLLCHTAFDQGITHFDLANNYGPPPGSAEVNFGRVLATDFRAHRDELIVSTKAGYAMWQGPYGEWGSRKHVLASLDQSLSRLQLDYVDLFYSHRFDPETPLEETMGALSSAVTSGKALYAGVSNYPPAETRRAAELLRAAGTPCVVHQPPYSLFNRELEHSGLLDTLDDEGMGAVIYSPLAQGLLTNRYLRDIPSNSRATHSEFLTAAQLTPDMLERIRSLNDFAKARGCTLAQLALCWALRDPRITSAIVGASRPEQLLDSVQALHQPPLSNAELDQLDRLCGL